MAELEPAAPASCCEMCATAPAKYSCPACAVKTCSVGCVKLHKGQAQCSGQRPAKQAKLVDMFDSRTHMSKEMALEEDVEFLFQGMDAVNKAAAAASSTTTSNTTVNKPANSQVVKRALHLGCTVKVMPSTLSMHTRNTSRMCKKRIHWRVEVWVKRGSGDASKVVVENVDEEAKLAEVIASATTANSSTGGGEEEAEWDVELELFEQPRLRIEDWQSITMQACLFNRTIIEFPVFHVSSVARPQQQPSATS